MNAPNIGSIEIGKTPRVIGTISTMSTLEHHEFCTSPPCHIAEVRLDQIGVESPWLEHCRAIEDAGIPVLATLRLAEEGGGWEGEDQQRLPHLQKALEHLSAVDVEAASSIRHDVAALAAEAGKPVIVSYHNFQETPALEQLEEILRDIRQTEAPVVPKIATMLRDDTDMHRLCRFLGDHRKDLLCISGMGERGIRTRVVFPCLGSCLTYGFLDDSVAPGQLSAQYLAATLQTLLPRHNTRFSCA